MRDSLRLVIVFHVLHLVYVYSLASHMSRDSSSNRSRLKSRTLSSRHRSKPYGNLPYGQASSATQRRKGVLGRFVDLLTPSFWLSKMRSRSLPETVEEGNGRPDESQECDEETGLQRSSAGDCNLSEFESEGGRDRSLEGGNGCLTSEEGRRKEGLDERQRGGASHEDVGDQTSVEERRKEEPEERKKEEQSLLLTSRVPLELEPPSDYHASSKATQSSFVTSPQSQINPQAGIHFKSTSKRNRPMFSINSFHSPISTRLTRSPFQSTFYPGRTMFGGASAARTLTCKRIRHDEEPVEPVRKKMKATNAISNESSLPVHSETAKRILEMLDPMSSPLQDVRRIPLSTMPGNASPLSFTPTSECVPSTLLLSNPKPSLHLSTAPPVEPLVSSHILADTFPTPQQSPEPQELTETPHSHPRSLFMLHTNQNVSVLTSQVSPAKGMEVRDLGLSASFERNAVSMTAHKKMSPHGTIVRGSSGGKMEQARRSGHYRRHMDEEEEHVSKPDLPNIPLPLPVGKSLPNFDLTQVKVAPSLTERPQTGLTSISFQFSQPTVKTASRGRCDVTSHGDISFSFSHPKHPEKEVKKAGIDLSTGSAVNRQSNVTDGSQGQACEKQTSQTGNETSPRTSVQSAAPCLTSTMFGPGSWKCAKCNSSDSTTCNACQTVRQNNKEKPDSSSVCNPLTSTETQVWNSTSSTQKASSQLTLDMFIKPNSWQCETCLIFNSPDATKCKACLSTKPGHVPQKSSITHPMPTAHLSKVDSWECGTCLVPNSRDATKCKACESHKPRASQTAGTSSMTPISALHSSKVGSWTCDTCLISNPSGVDQCRACQSVPPGATCSRSQSNLVESKTTELSDGSKQWSTGGFKLTGVLQVKTPSIESASGGNLSRGFKLSSTSSVIGGLFGSFKSNSGRSEEAGGGGFKLPSGTTLGKPSVPAESNLTVPPKAMSQTVSSGVAIGEGRGSRPETVDRASEDKSVGSAASLVVTDSASKPAEHCLIAPMMGGHFTSPEGEESEVMQGGCENLPSDLHADRERPSEKRGFQLAVPAFGVTTATLSDAHGACLPSATGGKAFQLGNHPVVSTSGESTGSNFAGFKLQFGQLSKNQTNQPFGLSTEACQKKESGGFNLHFKQPVATSDRPHSGLDTGKSLPTAFGRSGESSFSSIGGFQISSTSQNDKLFGSTTGDLSCDKPQSLSYGGAKLSTELFQSSELLNAKPQKSGQEKPAFHFGAEQQGLADQLPAPFGNVTGATIQVSGFQGGDKPAFSFNIGQSKIKKDPTFAGAGSLGSSVSVQPLHPFGQQNPLLGQSSLSSAAVQPFQFGLNPNPNHLPMTFQFGTQSQTSGRLLSDNPFNFPNPGGDSAAGDGMEDDAPSGFSRQHITGGYDFSNSLQPTPSFSFSAGQSQSTPFTNLTHTFTGCSGRKTKQAIRRLGKNKK